MKNPFHKKQKDEEVDAPEQESEEASLADLSIEELQARTEAIEQRKEEKRLAREERKFRKQQDVKRQRMERVLAPILLILTLLISALLYFSSR